MAESVGDQSQEFKSFWLTPRWLQKVGSANTRPVLFLLSALVGLLGGLGAVAFKELSILVQRLFMGPEPSMLVAAFQLPWYLKLGVPTAGGLLAGLVLYFLPKEAKGHGISEIMEAVTIRRGVLSLRGALVRSISSFLSIGSGASIGREGPIVQMAATLASKVAQYLKVSKENVSILVGCGVAAGLAAAYNVPIAASFFVMEIIIGNFAIDIFAPLVISSVTSTLVYRRIFGNDPVYGTPHFVLVSGWELAAYVLLGILSGMAAVAFRRSISFSEKRFNHLPGPIYLKSAIGGLLVGAIGLLWPHVWGNGFHAINLMLGNQMAIQLLVILFVMKIVATSLSVGSGASGGVFTPTQFVGATLGGAFGFVTHFLFPEHSAQASAYALVGMGCLMAGTTYAPIMAIMMIFETTLNYEIILPLMLSCIISSTVARRFNPESIYTEKLRMKGISYGMSMEETAMQSVHVLDLVRTDVPVVQGNIRFKDVVHELLKARSNLIYVVDDGKFIGSIDIHDLKEFFNEEALYSLVLARDISSPSAVVFPNQTLTEVMDTLYATDVDQIPVVENDASRKFVGVITRRDIIGAYNREVLKKKMLSAKFVTREKEREGIDYVEMPVGYRISKVAVPPGAAGKSLGEVNFRSRYRLQVVELVRTEEGGRSRRLIADPDLSLMPGDALIVIGTEEDLADYQNLVKG